MDLLRLTPSATWVEYFRYNANRQREIPWDSGAGLSAAEVEVIAASLPAWQRGESGEGAHLLAAARDYAAQVGDPEFVDAVRLFIAEEQRHGNYLGRFLDLAGVARAESDWGATVFRAFRLFLTKLEIWTTVVVMVEIHALVYLLQRHPPGDPVGGAAADLRAAPGGRGAAHPVSVRAAGHPAPGPEALAADTDPGDPSIPVHGDHAGDLGRASAGAPGRRLWFPSFLAERLGPDGACVANDGPGGLSLGGGVRADGPSAGLEQRADQLLDVGVAGLRRPGRKIIDPRTAVE